LTTISIIPATVEHRSLVLDSFWREYRESPQARGVPARVLLAKLDALLVSPSWKTVVATPEDDGSTVLGYLVFRDATTLGWLHVLRYWRGKGVARALLNYAGAVRGSLSCAFISPAVAKWAGPKGYALRFRPYLPDIAAAETAARIRQLVEET
jgi:GNAT superfamily N-acetyltransferase